MPVDADDQREAAASAGRHARLGVLHDHRTVGFGVQPACGLEQHCRVGFSGQTQLLGIDAVHPHGEQVGDPGGREHLDAVAAGGEHAGADSGGVAPGQGDAARGKKVLHAPISWFAVHEAQVVGFGERGPVLSGARRTPGQEVVEQFRPGRGVNRRAVGHHPVHVEDHRVVVARIDPRRRRCTVLHSSSLNESIRPVQGQRSATAAGQAGPPRRDPGPTTPPAPAVRDLPSAI